ncbi:MAG: ABC transporter permease [Candidatus Omnitrophica bacterium]|nr:ABC transporter permease [Candidatus Omnitrophota bacterium]
MILTFSIKRRLVRVRSALVELGEGTLNFIMDSGGLMILLGDAIRTLSLKPLRVRLLLTQMYKMGVQSLPLVALTAIFTGMVLALQSSYQLKMFSAVKFTADLVSLSVVRELGPVLTAMVVAGRVGAGITAELGTMKVTEQLDALKALATDPVHYLVVPRIVAGFFMLFVLTIFADIIGIIGGYVVCIFKLGISHHVYWTRTFVALTMRDLMSGLLKGFIFGIIISSVGCYFGFQTKGGAEGVGMATRTSVVVSLISIIAFDCFFTALFYFVL